MGDDRDTRGRFTKRHSDGAVLEAVRAHEPAATSEVADELGIARQSADYRLRRLQEDDRVASKKIGASLVWFLDEETAEGDDISASGLSADRGPPAGPPDHSLVHPPGSAGQTSTPDHDTGDAASEFADGHPGETASAETDEPVPADVDELVNEVAGETLPGSGAKLEARREAFTAVVGYLRERGSATPQDFKEDVYPDHQAMYTDGQDPALSWWKNAMYPALRELAERTAVIERADTTGEWTYREGER